jgi:glycosyltransferase involved in cell wall biosynthesis
MRPFTIIILYGPPPWDVIGRVQKLAFHFSREAPVLYCYVQWWRSFMAHQAARAPRWAAPSEAKFFEIVPTPTFLPLGSILGIRYLNGWRVARKIRRLLAARGVREEDALFMVTDPGAAEAVRLFRRNRVVYDCSDDFDEWHFLPRRVLEIRKRNEHWIAQHAEAVIATSDRLREKMLQLTRRVYQIGNGVDFDLFATGGQEKVPTELRMLAHPIVGFTGAAEGYVDIELVRDIARKHRDCSFVFLGPLERVQAQLQSEPNVHFLGFRRYEDLPRYVSHFDVSFIPANKRSASLSAEPSKLYQSLAAGKPVLCTDLPELMKHAAFVHVFRNAEEFSQALEQAMTESGEQAEKRREYARQFDWSRRAAEISRIIAELPRQAASQR